MKMKIWVIGRGYPTPANKMWGSFELEQAKLLARNGHEVAYIALTLSFFDRKDPRGMRKFDEDGVKIFAYSHLYFPGKLGFYWERYEDKCWQLLFDAAKAETGLPDIIHVHYPSMLSSINVIEEYRKKSVRVFVTEHWSRVLTNNLHGHELNRLKYYASHANCFICVSELLLNAAKKLVPFSVPAEIIPNIVSPVFFNSKQKKDEKNFTFISIGRLVPLKQFDVIISQFLTAFADHPDVKLKIIGTGPEEKRLKSLAGNSPQISFTGEISLPDVANELSSSDALVSYSKYETFANPVAEAWACGIPAIVSENSGISSYCKNENLGLVISNDNPENLGNALKYLYLNGKHYDSEKIKQFGSSHFRDETVSVLLEKTYFGK